MKKEIKLNHFIEEEDEVEIGQWYIQEGEIFSKDQIILEVIANKAVMEISLGMEGKLISILHHDGEIISIKEAFAVIETEDE